MTRLVALAISIAFQITYVSVNARGASGNDFWPCWRGPDSTGKARSGNPPITWSETENIKWKVKVPGDSSSTPIVWADKIFFLTAVETDKKVMPPAEVNAPKDQPPAPTGPGGGPGRGGMMSKPPTSVYKFDVVCMDRKTGNIIWQKTAREEVPHEGHQPNGSFAPYSPVTDGKYVWAGFGSHGVYCFDFEGNLKWIRDLGKMKIRNAFGEGSSPALAGNALIIVMDHEGGSFIYALNKETGETLWQNQRDEGTSWATPLPVETKGKVQIITNAGKFVRSYDLKTGELLWKCNGQVDGVIPTPVSGFGKVFCISGFKGGALQAIELDRSGDISDSNAISWQDKQVIPFVASPISL